MKGFTPKDVMKTQFLISSTSDAASVDPCHSPLNAREPRQQTKAPHGVCGLRRQINSSKSLESHLKGEAAVKRYDLRVAGALCVM